MTSFAVLSLLLSVGADEFEACPAMGAEKQDAQSQAAWVGCRKRTRPMGGVTAGTWCLTQDLEAALPGAGAVV